jgi:hypothetical protein
MAGKLLPGFPVRRQELLTGCVRNCEINLARGFYRAMLSVNVTERTVIVRQQHNLPVRRPLSASELPA